MTTAKIRKKALLITALTMLAISLFVFLYIYFEAWEVVMVATIPLSFFGCFMLIYSVVVDVLKTDHS